jgi:hypothetical protein
MFLNFVEYLFSFSRVVGILLISYGGVLAVIPDSNTLNVIGMISYYLGTYQAFVMAPDIENLDGEYSV